MRDGTELGQKAKEYMDAGDLVPDELIVDVIGERIATAEARDGFILDGFPRTTGQADALDEKFGQLGRTLTAAILIDVGDEEVIRRLGGRRTCVNDGHIFHVEFDPPKNEGVCDVCGGELDVRDDDKPEVIRHRLATYRDKTEPLVERYETAGMLRRVDGDRPPDEVADRIRGAARDAADGGGGLSRPLPGAAILSWPRCTAAESSSRPPSRSSRWRPPARSRPAA